MNRRLFGGVRRLLMPVSLRYQLLSRSLFILAALLLLIGGLQYVLMQHFLYQNKAQSIKSQLLYIPPDVWLQEGDQGDGVRVRDRSGAVGGVSGEPAAGGVSDSGAGGGSGGSIGDGTSAGAGSGDAGASGGHGADSSDGGGTNAGSGAVGGNSGTANMDPPSLHGRGPVRAAQGAAGGPGPGGRPGADRGPDAFFQSSFFVSDSTLAFYGMDGTLTPVSENPRGGTAPLLSAADYKHALGQQPDEVNYRVNRDPQGVVQLVVLVPVSIRGHVQGIAELATLAGPLRQELLRQLLTFLALSLLALLVGLLTFKPILRRTLVPLSRIVETVERIDAGNLDEQLPSRQGQLEIDRLSGSLGHMLERLKDAFEAEKEAKEQMRRFVADASHELRTPLTSIHGFLEVLLRGAAANPEQLQRALSSMYSESERLNKLVHDLLMLARLDRSPTVSLIKGHLDDVLMEMEPQLRLLAGVRAVHFRVEREVACRFDRDNIKQIVLNLFHNAVQHTDPGAGEVSIELRRDGGKAVLAIADNGPGIAEEHQPHLFDRFYRADTSRTRRSGGAGLGLAITKSIVDLHGGTIDVHSRPGNGSRFIVRLPLVEEEPIEDVGETQEE